MKLTPEQQSAVTRWINSGASIADVQQKLRDEFGISLTYMDARFLVDDLGLDVKSQPKLAANTDLNAPTPAATSAGPAEKTAGGTGDADEDFPEDDDLGELDTAGAGDVSLEVDTITRPGTVVSGSVTFSDGVSGKWALDQYGRLMLDTGKPGYQPSAGDVQKFQQVLSQELQRKGF